MRVNHPPLPRVKAESAGLFRRLFALGLDLVLIGLLLLVSNLLVEAAFQEHLSRTILDVEGHRFATLQARYQLGAWMGGTLLALLYLTLGEGSPWQGTPGKRACSCHVVRSDGGTAGLVRLLWRNMAKMLSAAPCFLGFALAAVTPGKRALHDFVSGCRVVVTRRDTRSGRSRS